MASALTSPGGAIPSQRVVRTAGGLSKGGDGSDGIPRSSFMQVPLSTQSEQLSRGRKVFEELSSFAKDRFQSEEKTAHAGLRAGRLSASEYEIPGGSLQKGFMALRRFCVNESRQHSVLARQMQEQFHQPLEQAMSRHADMVMRAKLGVQRSAQLVQESENRLAKGKRQLVKAQADEKQHREALARGRQDARASRKDIEWLTNRAARALDSARHAEAVALGERHQLLQAMKTRDEAVAGAARSFEAAERERAVTAARAIASFTARQREFYAAQTRDLDSLGQMVEALDPDGDIDAFIEDKKVPDNAPVYRVALYLLDWARSDQPTPQQQQQQHAKTEKKSDAGAQGNGDLLPSLEIGDHAVEGGGGGGGPRAEGSTAAATVGVGVGEGPGGKEMRRDIEALLRRLIPNQVGGGKETRPKDPPETDATAAADVIASDATARARPAKEEPAVVTVMPVAETRTEMETETGTEMETENTTEKSEAEAPVQKSPASAATVSTAEAVAKSAATAKDEAESSVEGASAPVADGAPWEDSWATGEVGSAGREKQEGLAPEGSALFERGSVEVAEATRATRTRRDMLEDDDKPLSEEESAEAAQRELEKLLRLEQGRSRFLQALNERRSVATEVTPEAYHALVETLRVFLDGCSPRTQRSGGRNRSRSGSRSRSSSRSCVDESSAAGGGAGAGGGAAAVSELSSSSSSSSLSFPLGGAFVGPIGRDISNSEADEEDDDDVIMVEEGGEEGHVLLSKSSMNSTLLPSPASSAKSPENLEREEGARGGGFGGRRSGKNGGGRGGSTPGDSVTTPRARARTMPVKSTTFTKSPPSSPMRSPTASPMNTFASSPPRRAGSDVIHASLVSPELQRRTSSGSGGKNILDFAASIVRGENRSPQQRGPNSGGPGPGPGPFQRGAFRGGGATVVVPGARGGGAASFAAVGGTMGARMVSRFGSSSSSSQARHQDLASRHESDEAALQKVVEAALGRGQGAVQFSGGGRGGRRGSRVGAAAGVIQGGGRGREDWEEGEIDIRSARQAMILANTFFKTERTEQKGPGERPERIYLLRQLRDHPLWRHPRFWDEALMMGVKEQLLEGPANVRWDDLQGEARRDAVARTHNVVFSQLASIAFNMLECGIEGDRVRSEVTRKCRESQLGEAQVQELLRDLNRRIRRAEQDPRGVDRLPSWWSIVADEGADPSPSKASKASTPASISTLASASALASASVTSTTPQLGRRQTPPSATALGVSLARSPPRSSTAPGGGSGERASRSRSDSVLAAERAGRNVAATTASPSTQQHQQRNRQHQDQHQHEQSQQAHQQQQVHEKQQTYHQQQAQQQNEQKYSAEMEFVREAAELANRRRRRSPKPRRPPPRAPVTALIPLGVERRSSSAGEVTAMTDEDEYDML